MTVLGIDISNYQGASYSVAGLGFVVVKATEGTGYVNPKHDAQVAYGRAHSLVIGHYHYGHHGNSAAQADYFLAHAGARPGDFLAYDWEDGATTQADRDAFIARIRAKAPSLRIVVYCNKDFWLHRDSENGAADGLWIADPSSPEGHPGVKHAWLMHQYSEAGGVDHDIANFADKAAMAAWAGGTKPKPKPAAHPKVSLALLIKAARTDPHAKQGHVTYAAGVKLIEAALRAEKLLASAYASDGSFGSLTLRAYAGWQRRCHYSGKAADGIPGHDSLVRLGAKHGFDVIA